MGLSPEDNDLRNNLPYNQKSNTEYILKQFKCDNLQPSKIISDKYSHLHLEAAYNDLLKRRKSPITYIINWN